MMPRMICYGLNENSYKKKTPKKTTYILVVVVCGRYKIEPHRVRSVGAYGFLNILIFKSNISFVFYRSILPSLP